MLGPGKMLPLVKALQVQFGSVTCCTIHKWKDSDSP